VSNFFSGTQVDTIFFNGIQVNPLDKFKYSFSTNSMNNSLNSMPCSNNDHVDRLDFLENEKEETFMFEP
jgi:hypothetical protein